MPINECCSHDVVCCDADCGIPQVAALMRKHHVGDVIVTENQNGMDVPVGIVTDRDIVMEAVALQVDVNVFTAGDMMSTPVTTVRENAGVIETLRMMRNHNVRRLPVVTEAGGLSGIVTADNIINLLARELSMMADAIIEQPAKEANLRK